MSDTESHGENPNVEEEEPIDGLVSAVKKVLKNAAAYDGVVRGLHQCAKSLDAKTAQVCFLSQSVNEPAYKKLAHALCKEHNTPVVEVPDSKELGEWAGLCKFDEEGIARKTVGASCVVVNDFGEESDALVYLQGHLRSMA